MCYKKLTQIKNLKNESLSNKNLAKFGMSISVGFQTYCDGGLTSSMTSSAG